LLFVPVAFGLTSMLIIAPWFVQIPGLKLTGFASGIILLIVSIRACVLQFRSRFTDSAITIMGGTIIFEIILGVAVLPKLEYIKISPSIARDINAKTASDVPVASYKFNEPSLNFYVGRKIEQLNGKSVLSWMQNQKQSVLIIPSDIFDKLRQGNRDLIFSEISSKKGYNYSKGDPLTVIAVLLGKEGSQ
jgi:hypothetical protein